MKLILMTAMMVFSCSSFAAEKQPSVAHVMKDMGKLFKQLKAEVKDSTKNARSLVAAKEFLRLYKVSLEQSREGAAVVFQPHQLEAAVADYKKLILLGIADAEGLVKALEANDNDSAKHFIEKLKKNEVDGHGKYTKD